MTRLQTVMDRAQRHAERMPRAHVRWARYYRLRAHHFNRAGSSIEAGKMFRFEARHLELARARQ